MRPLRGQLQALLRPADSCSAPAALGVCRAEVGVSSSLAWKIPWMEEPGRLQSMGSHLGAAGDVNRALALRAGGAQSQLMKNSSESATELGVSVPKANSFHP